MPNNQNIEKTSTVELVIRLSKLSQAIELQYLKYESATEPQIKKLMKKDINSLIDLYEPIRKELVKRFPMLIQSEEFKPIRKR